MLGNDRSITPKTVTLGASDGVNVQILSGVTEGEKLVYSLKSVSKSEVSNEATSESPFMPKPPGANKKK